MNIITILPSTLDSEKSVLFFISSDYRFHSKTCISNLINKENMENIQNYVKKKKNTGNIIIKTMFLIN